MYAKPYLYQPILFETDLKEELFKLGAVIGYMIVSFFLLFNLFIANYTLAGVNALFLFMLAILHWLFKKKYLAPTTVYRLFLLSIFIMVISGIIFDPNITQSMLFSIYFPVMLFLFCPQKRALIGLALFLGTLFLLFSFHLTPLEPLWTLWLPLLFAFLPISYLINFYTQKQFTFFDIVMKQTSLLQTSHHTLDRLVNHSHLLISSFDKDGFLTYMGAFELHIRKQTLQELIGLHYSKIYADEAELVHNIQNIYGHIKKSFTATIYNRIFKTQAAPDYDEQKHFIGYTLISTDISDITQMKEALGESQKRFEAIFDTALEAIVISKDQVIIDCNQKMLAMSGFKSKEALIGKTFSELITADSLKNVQQHLQKEHEDTPYTIEFIRHDGALIPMRVRGRYINIQSQRYRISVLEDIYELKKTEQELAKLAKAVNQSHSLISITDRYGVIEYVNQAYIDTMGYSKEELIGKNFSMIQSGYQDKHFYETLWETINRGDAFSHEMVNRKKDGSLCIVQNSISSIKDEKGHITHFISIQEDITAQKEQEKAMLLQSRQAQMGEMLSMIAHQWRQPLATISAIDAKMLFGLELDQLTPSTLKQNIKKIDEQVLYLSETINDFRNFFKPDKTPHDVRMAAVLQKSIDLFSKKLELEDVNIFIQNPDNPTIKTFANELIQVFLNLIKNSLDQISSKGLKNQSIEIEVTNHEKEVEIHFADHAGGIDPAIIEDIFLPYFSTKYEKQGTGLGLYMSKTIIEEHCKGQLRASNSRDGAVFTIILPKSL